MIKKLIVFAALLLLAAPAAAQEEPTPGEVQAVRELLEASGTRETFIRAIELGMAEAGGEDLTPAVRQVVREFMDEHFRYEDLEPEFIRIYTDLYSEEELRAITAFYRTPAGRRMAEVAADMAVRSQRIAMARMQARMPELMQRLMEVMEEEEEEGAAGSGSKS